MERFIVVVQRAVSDTIPFSWLVVQNITYQLILAGSSAQAHEVATTFKPDLFLIEHNPPSLDGIALSHQLHALPGQEDIPMFVVLLAPSSPTDCPHIDGYNVNYIDGPFELTHLLRLVESMAIMPVH